MRRRKEALAASRAGFPDLVIIDINLGAEVEGGFELCRELRARSAQLPIIFLTARESELDAVSGLTPRRRRLPHEAHEPRALARARRGAVPARRGAALQRGARASGSSKARSVLDRDRMTAAVAGSGRAADSDRVLGRACARLASRARAQSRAAHGRGQRRARRRYGHFPDQANPREVPRGGPQVRRIQTVYGMGYRWQAD